MAASSNKSVKDIAKSLGISVSSYHSKTKASKVKTKLRDSIDLINSISKEELLSDIDSGLSVADICKKRNLTRSNYKMLMEKFDIKTPQRRMQNKKG